MVRVPRPREKTPSCPRHPGSHVVRHGRRLRDRRQRYLCRSGAGARHTFTPSLAEERVGTCLTCLRGWEGGLPLARWARFLLAQVVSCVQLIGGGSSLGRAAERIRVEHRQLGQRRDRMAGRPDRLRGSVSDDGRLAADWLERYGALVVAELMPKGWPKATIIVDAKSFKRRARYGKDHPSKAGFPTPSGELVFAVLAAAVRGPGGKLRVLHIRATPDDHKGSWVDFFRSLPGKPECILSDPDPQIGYAIAAVWPNEPPLHPLSVWHYYDKLREKFTQARRYPETDPLCRDAQAAFATPQHFRVWRERAMHEGPEGVRTWLRKKGNEVEARLQDPRRPLAIGALETFLTQRVGWALEAGHGKIRNLRRLDIRLGLIALDQNRALSGETLRRILQEGLANQRDRPIPRRSLDGSTYQPGWLFLPQANRAGAAYAAINH